MIIMHINKIIMSRHLESYEVKLIMSCNIDVRDGGSGGGEVDPPIRADMTFIRAKDKTFFRGHSGKTGFDPPKWMLARTPMSCNNDNVHIVAGAEAP